MAVAEQLPRELTDQSAGKTRIEEVRVEVRQDSSERPALSIVLVLSDPPKGAETWPIDDLWALRRLVRDAMAETEAELNGMPWFVVFESKSHEPLDPEDTAEQLDVDG